MIHYKENISQHDAQYILEEVLPKRGWRINNQTLSHWEKAHNIMFQEQVGIPGCSCEYVATYNVWKSRVEQYEQQLRDIAYPPVVEEKLTRGRKKNG